MKSRFRNFFQPPVFIDNPELSRRAQTLLTILYGLFAATCAWAWYPIFIQGGAQIIVALVVLSLEVGMFALLKASKIALVGSLLSLTLWVALIIFMLTFGGIRNSGFVTFTVVIVISTLTLGSKFGLGLTILTILAGLGMVIAENRGMLPVYVYEPGYTILISQGLNLLGVSLLLFLAMRNLNRAMASSQENEKAQKEINKLLEANRMELEARTEAVEQRNIILETIADVARLASQTKNETELINQIARLLAENIRLDFVNIFILDQTEQFVILAGTNVHQNLEQLFVRKTEVGYPFFSTETTTYQIGESDYHIQRPHLYPETKSNITLPLKSGSRLFGLINIQTISPVSAQFNEQTMQIFADQIALSLENIRLFEQLQTRVREVSALAAQSTQDAWDQLRGGDTLGYNYDRLRVLPTKEHFPAEVSVKIMNHQIVTYVTNDVPQRSKLVAPIIVRENVIGVIGYEETNPDYVWQESEKTLLETVASRVSLALENSRLVAEAERRAAQERSISQAASRMRETLDVNSVLKTAAIEIRRALNAERTEVRLRMANEENR